jgi:hypothetical protein
MVRAFIGAIAVLAAFAVIEKSVDASTGDLGACKAVQAYAMMQPGEGLTVRAEPSPEAMVIGNLSVGGEQDGPLMSTVVTLTASQSGWVRIALQSAKDYNALDKAGRQYGWIPADLLSVDARTKDAITVYSRPGLMGKALTKIENEDVKFRVLGCRGDWLQVINARHGNIWIDKWCANPEEGCRQHS